MGALHHPLVDLARAAITAYITDGVVISPSINLPADLPQKAAVFVSLHLSDGDLRGCIGTVVPTEDTLAEQVIQEAIAAATMDPRFMPVSTGELDDLVIHVDILNPPERIGSMEELDVKRYGVIVDIGRRRGLLLPDIEGVNTVEDQIAIARRKAGIGPREQIALSRFTVTRLT
jgi:AmmeMemoRadiSam system protein A